MHRMGRQLRFIPTTVSKRSSATGRYLATRLWIWSQIMLLNFHIICDVVHELQFFLLSFIANSLLLSYIHFYKFLAKSLNTTVRLLRHFKPCFISFIFLAHMFVSRFSSHEPIIFFFFIPLRFWQVIICCNIIVEKRM